MDVIRRNLAVILTNETAIRHIAYRLLAPHGNHDEKARKTAKSKYSQGIKRIPNSKGSGKTKSIP